MPSNWKSTVWLLEVGSAVGLGVRLEVGLLGVGLLEGGGGVKGDVGPSMM